MDDRERSESAAEREAARKQRLDELERPHAEGKLGDVRGEKALRQQRERLASSMLRGGLDVEAVLRDEQRRVRIARRDKLRPRRR